MTKKKMAITSYFLLNILNIWLIKPYIESTKEFLSFALPFIIISTAILYWYAPKYNKK